MPSSPSSYTFVLVLASLLHRWPCGCVSPAEGGDVIASCPDCAEGTCPSCGDFGNCRCSCECPVHR